MSIPGWLEKLPDGFGVVNTGIGDVEGHAVSKADLVETLS
jgi:hypothetical protein